MACYFQLTIQAVIISYLATSIHAGHKNKRQQSDPRIYVFGFSNDGFPTNFVEDGKLIGHSVDLTQAVCDYAGKTCKMVLAQRKQCWDSTSGFPPFSIALNARYWDSCASFQESPERKMTYAFPSQTFFRSPFPTLITSTRSKLTLNDLEECNDYTLAYPENTVLEPDCLLDFGLYIRERNFVPIRTTDDFQLTTIMNAVTKAVVDGQVDLGIVLTRFTRTDDVRILAELTCEGQVAKGLNHMFRKDEIELMNWWDPMLHKFLCSNKYTEFCNGLKTSELYSGTDPLCRVPGDDLDCSQFGGPGIKPKDAEKVRRINPCITEVCRKKNRLDYSSYKDEVYELKDDQGKAPENALEGSGGAYAGSKKSDLRLTIVASDGSFFRPDKVCLKVKNVREAKFQFKGGESEIEEINVLIDFRQEWTEMCERSEQFRKNVKIDFKLASQFDDKIRIKDMYMDGCTEQAYIEK